MFTGIIEELGTVEAAGAAPAGRAARRCCRTAREGASIAVNGVCLTAVGLRPDSLQRRPRARRPCGARNLGDLRAGSRVNLERPLSPDGRLSGHIVQGHVDGTGEFVSLDALGDDNWWLRIRVPEELDPLPGLQRLDRDRRHQPDDRRAGRPAALRDDHPPHLPQHHARRLSSRLARESANATSWRSTWRSCCEKSDVKKGLTVEKLREEGY